MKQSPLFLLYLIALLLFQSACETDPSDASSNNGETSETVKVHTRIQAEPTYLSPILATNSWSSRVNNHIFQTLLEYDPYTLKLSPVLAKSLPEEIVVAEGPYKGKTAYVFEIHEEAVWDDGSPIDGNDYEFSIKAVFNPMITTGAPAYRSHVGVIQDVEIDPTNAKRFTVYTRENYIRAMYVSGFYVYPEHIYDPKGLMKDIQLKDLTDNAKASELAEENENLATFAKEFVSPEYSKNIDVVSGSGAYKLDNWIPNDRVILKKKENWWGNQLVDRYPMLTAVPDELIFRPVRDATAALSLLRSKEVDFVGRIPSEQFSKLKEDESFKSDFELHTPATTIYNYIGINTTNPKLSDKRVRQALAYCINIDEIINNIQKGDAKKIVGPIPPYFDYYHKGLEPYSLNLEKAKALLTEAGWTDTDGNGIVDKVVDGEKLELTLEYNMTPQNINSEKVAILFKEEARKVGVNIEPKVKEANLLIKDRNSGNYELFILGASSDFGLYDPKQLWYTTSGANYTRFGNAESDALIDNIRTELDETKRNKLYLEFQELLYDEMPVIFLFNAADHVVINKKFKNFKPSMKSPCIFENYLTLN
ncbi:MAG: ABC transporter substrate-binding protein [Bacteroidota bacterium]